MAPNDNSNAMGLHMDYGLRPTHTIAGACIICFLATILVLLRVYCRLRLIKTFGLDDWILLLAFTLYMFMSSVFIGRGVSMNNLSSDKAFMADTTKLGQLGLAVFLLYLVAQIALKLALATFFLRIPGTRVTRLIIIGSVSFYTLFTTIYFFLSFFRCGLTPWDTGYYHSWDNPACSEWLKASQAFDVAQASLNAVVDWIFCLTPIFVVARSPTIPMATKLSVCALILLGSLGSVVSIARIVFLAPEVAPNSFGRMTSQPHLLHVQFSCVLETGTGIVCLAMAALRPLSRALVQKCKAGMMQRSCNPEQATSTGQSIELDKSGNKEKLTKMAFTDGKDLDLFSDDDLMDGTTLGEGKSSQNSWYEYSGSPVETEDRDHIDAAEKGEAHMTS